MAKSSDDTKVCKACGKRYARADLPSPVSNARWRERRVCSRACQMARMQSMKSRLTHGHARKGSRSREYNAYLAMRARCNVPTHKDYPNYGGRGIAICPEWCGPDGFHAFLDHVGECPKGLTLDRIDSNGDYAPGNVRWVTRKEQARNRRITVSDDGKSIGEWAEILGINYRTLMDRWRRGDRGERLRRPVTPAGRAALQETPKNG